MPTLAIAIFVAVFTIATFRNIHLGVLMIPADRGYPCGACADGCPLATSGGVAGWALMSAMGVCASIVDASPFSTTGALLIASAADERPRLKSLLTRWGLSMVIVGPAVATLVLLLLGPS